MFLDGELLLSTPRALTDGSRALLARGYDSDLLMTVRVRGKAYDSFNPIKIGTAAKWTVSERDGKGLSLEPWKPYSSPGERPSGAIRPGEGVPVPHTDMAA